MPRTLDQYRQDLGVDLPDDILQEAVKGFDTNFKVGAAKSPGIPGTTQKIPGMPDLADFRKSVGVDVPDDILAEAAKSLYPDQFPASVTPTGPVPPEKTLFQKTSAAAKNIFQTVPSELHDAGLKAILSLSNAPQNDTGEVPQLAIHPEGADVGKKLLLAGAEHLTGIYEGLTGQKIPLSEEAKTSIEANQVSPTIARTSGEIVGGLGLFLGVGKALQAGKAGEAVMASFARTPQLARVLGAATRTGIEFGGAGGFKEAIKQVSDGKLDPTEFGKVVLKDTAIGAGFGTVTAGTAGQFENAIADTMAQTAGASAYGFGVSALQGHDLLTSVVSGATAGLYALAGAKDATEAQKVGAFNTAKINVETAARQEAMNRGYAEEQAQTFADIASEKFTNFVNRIGGEKVSIRNWDKVSKDIYAEMNDLFEKGDPIARVPKDVLLDVLKNEPTGQSAAGPTPKTPENPSSPPKGEPLKLVPAPESDITTIDGDLFGGPEGVKSFQTDLPLLSQSILGKTFPVPPEQVQAGLELALRARNIVLKNGGHPDDAQLVAMESFLDSIGGGQSIVPHGTKSVDNQVELAPQQQIQEVAKSVGLEPYQLTYDQFKRAFSEDIQGMPEEEIRADYRQTIMSAIRTGKDVPESIVQGLQLRVGVPELSPLAGAPAAPTSEPTSKKVRVDARGIPIRKPNSIVLKLDLGNGQTATLNHQAALDSAKSLMHETIDRWEESKVGDLLKNVGRIRWTEELANLGDLSGDVVPGWLKARIFTKDASAPTLDERAQELGKSSNDLIQEIVDYPKTAKKAPSRNLADYYQEAIRDWEYFTMNPNAHQVREKTGRYEAFLGSQRNKEGMQAAVRDPQTGEIYSGPSHSEIIRDAIKADPDVAERLTKEIFDGSNEVGFIDENGEFINRRQAERRFGILNSEDLSNRKAAESYTARQSAYHGSPYRFDKFSLQKIGTGEGNQTFGWGLYFSGKKDVAEYYRRMLTPPEEIPAKVRLAFGYLDNLGFDSFQGALTAVRANPVDWKEMWDVKPLRDPKEMMAAHNIEEFLKQPEQKGHIYHVDIPEDGDYLNWDKPLKENSKKVQDLLKKALGERYLGTSDGSNLYRELKGRLGEELKIDTSSEGVSHYLNSIGIPGLRYLDQGSRITGEGTYNYVLFDDSKIKINKVTESKQLDVSDVMNGTPIGKVRSATEFKRSEVDVAFNGKSPKEPDLFLKQGPREIYQSAFAVKYQKTGSLTIPNQKIYSPHDIAFAFRFLHNEAVEHFLVGAVKNGNIVGVEMVAVGRIDEVSVDFFDLFHLLDHVEADGYFLVHNHPSGVPEPSEPDVKLTNASMSILNRSGYKFLGHVVIDDTTFGFIDDQLKVRQWQHKEYEQTKEVPLLKKYLDWTKAKADLPTSLTSPRAVFEIAKGIEKGLDDGVVFLLNTQNRVLNAIVIPKSQMNTGDLQRLAGRYRGNRIILANSSIPESQLPIVRRDLRSAGIALLDDINSSTTGYRSAMEAGILNEPAEATYNNLQLSDQTGIYTARESLDDEYARARYFKRPSIKDNTIKFLQGQKTAMLKFAKDVGITLTGRLNSIHPDLKLAFRKFTHDTNMGIMYDMKRNVPLLKLLQKMEKENKVDAIIFELAMAGGDKAMQTDMARKYDGMDALERSRSYLKDILPEIRSVGFQVGYRDGYFPRALKDFEGLKKHLMEKEGKIWSEIEAAIADKEDSLRRTLNDEERGNLINSFFRGFTRSKIALARTGNMKTREIEKLTVDVYQFYYRMGEALARYIPQVREAIEARKFFGRIETKPNFNPQAQLALEDLPESVRSESAMSFNKIDDSIGALTNRLLLAHKITPEQEVELKRLFQARFGYIGSHGALGLYRDLTYMNTITGFASALSNLGDLGLTMYKATWQTPGSFIRALADRSKIKLDDMGLERLDQEIREATVSSTALRTFLKGYGFSFLDRVGKETHVNAVIDRYRQIARSGTATLDERFQSLFGTKGERFEETLSDIFGPEVDQVLKDLKEGRTTENIIFLAFNELSELQPLSLGEVPLIFLESPGARPFFLLKTFALKQLNFKIEEVRTAPNKKEGLRRLISLLAWLTVIGIPINVLKDIVSGRKIRWDYAVTDSIFQAFGFPKYLLYRVRANGPKEILGYFLLPPIPMIEALFKDTKTILNDTKVKTGLHTKEDRMFESTRSFPIGGYEWYWWFGRGAQKMREQEYKSQSKARKNHL